MDELLSIAIDAARAAGALLLERFSQPGSGVGTKSSGTDMVSDADRAAEALIGERIGRARPADGVLAEESAESIGSSGVRWIVDPLDGTTNFLYGIPHWAVSIAAERDGRTLAGVVYDPTRAELFAATHDRGATLNGTPVRVSSQQDLHEALVSTGFSYASGERATQARLLERVLPAVRDLRRAGAASLDLAWVACGRTDAFFEAGLAPWDRAAGELIVREAGGVVGSMPAVGPKGDGAIAAGPGIFEALRALVTG